MNLEIKKGSVVYAKVDAIVNAANKNLLAGGGVCGAIFSKCGHPRRLQEECNKLAPINDGEAVITSGYNLNAKYIIHAVGPVYDNDQESAPVLASAYLSCLKLADSKGLKTIAIPSISTGIFGYPLDKACKIAIKTILDYVPTSLERCYIYCFDDREYNKFNETINK